jgi:hypothetical protein
VPGVVLGPVPRICRRLRECDDGIENLSSWVDPRDKPEEDGVVR